MAFTQSNIVRGSDGDAYSYSGTFTSAVGDNTLSITHGMNQVRLQSAGLVAVNAETPKISNSAGVATIIWSDTLGASGYFHFIGK